MKPKMVVKMYHANGNVSIVRLPESDYKSTAAYVKSVTFDGPKFAAQPESVLLAVVVRVHEQAK